MDNRDVLRAASGVCLLVASELTHISGRNCLLAADERDVGLSPFLPLDAIAMLGMRNMFKGFSCPDISS